MVSHDSNTADHRGAGRGRRRRVGAGRAGRGSRQRIYQAGGALGGTAVRVPQSLTFMVVTSGGNVIVDTSIAAAAPAHKQALTAINDAPIRAIVLTHAHGDHAGGIGIWQQPGTQVIAQRTYPEFLASTERPGG